MSCENSATNNNSLPTSSKSESAENVAKPNKKPNGKRKVKNAGQAELDDRANTSSASTKANRKAAKDDEKLSDLVMLNEEAKKFRNKKHINACIKLNYSKESCESVRVTIPMKKAPAFGTSLPTSTTNWNNESGAAEHNADSRLPKWMQKVENKRFAGNNRSGNSNRLAGNNRSGNSNRSENGTRFDGNNRTRDNIRFDGNNRSENYSRSGNNNRSENGTRFDGNNRSGDGNRFDSNNRSWNAQNRRQEEPPKWQGRNVAPYNANNRASQPPYRRTNETDRYGQSSNRDEQNRPRQSEPFRQSGPSITTGRSNHLWQCNRPTAFGQQSRTEQRRSAPPRQQEQRATERTGEPTQSNAGKQKREAKAEDQAENAGPVWEDYFVGVVVQAPTEQDDRLGLLVYDFKQRNFAAKVFVRNDPSILPSCNLGTWLRLLFAKPVDLEHYHTNPDQTVERLKKAMVCQRRLTTRVRDGAVNFLVQTNRQKKGTRQPNVHLFHCRLGFMRLTTEELMDGELVDAEAAMAEDQLPDRLKLWCTHMEMKPEKAKKQRRQGNPQSTFGYKQMDWTVTKIDERIWVTTDPESNEDDCGRSETIVDEQLLADRLSCCAIVEEQHCQTTQQRAAVLSPEFCGWLSDTIQCHFESTRLPDARKRAIDQFVEQLRDQLRTALQMPGLELKLFGSVNSGFGSADCDLDICMVHTGIALPDEDNRKRRRLLLAVVECMRKDSHFHDVISVLDARTPIVKFTHQASGFNGDISVENELAIWNTLLLERYAHFDARVAALGLALKRWAKLCAINDASAGSVSSYALIVMLIAFLQRTEPPVLPFLQEEQIDNATMPAGTVEQCFVVFRTELDELRPRFQNGQSVAELFQSFLHYYANTFDPCRQVAQIRTSEAYDKEARNMESARRLCVEDPFDLEHNLTAGVRTDTLDHILKCMRSTLRGMQLFDRQHFCGEAATQPPDEMDFGHFVAKFRPKRVVHVKRKKPVAAKQNGTEATNERVEQTTTKVNEENSVIKVKEIMHQEELLQEGQPDEEKLLQEESAASESCSNGMADGVVEESSSVCSPFPTGAIPRVHRSMAKKPGSNKKIKKQQQQSVKR